jgi:isopenicillin N synthase-like dioxygenase
MVGYLDACTELSLKLLEAFCLGLDLPADFMRRDFAGEHTGFIRLNYYPTSDPMADSGDEHQASADLGIHHHTDAGGLTVLLQDEVSGLQVHRDGLWYDIPTVEGAMVINTGDMMQVWSNDIYKAAIHRVLAMSTRERYSIPFFFNPVASCEVSPLPSVVDEQNPSRYRPIEWGSFRGKRSDGDYADYGTEVQISQYRK